MAGGPAAASGGAGALPICQLENVPQVSAAVRANLRRVLDAHRRARAQHGSIESGAIGLVTIPEGSCMFVMWTDAKNKMARPVRVDTDGRLISMVHFAQPVGNYNDCDIVVGNTGIKQPYQIRKKDRPAVDP